MKVGRIKIEAGNSSLTIHLIPYVTSVSNTAKTPASTCACLFIPKEPIIDSRDELLILDPGYNRSIYPAKDIGETVKIHVRNFRFYDASTISRINDVPIRIIAANAASIFRITASQPRCCSRNPAKTPTTYPPTSPARLADIPSQKE